MPAMKRKPGQIQDSQLCHFMERKALGPLLYIHTYGEEISPLDFLKIMDMPEDSPSTQIVSGTVEQTSLDDGFSFFTGDSVAKSLNSPNIAGSSEGHATEDLEGCSLLHLACETEDIIRMLELLL
ncbi:hypothetical protein U1Q18_037913 [Sarracenia purpurea var. burkii]